MSGQLHTAAALPPGEEIVWTPDPIWTTWSRENSWLHRDSNSDPSVIQPVASRYTDHAIPAPITEVC
jgi:hypothetical protein